MSPPRPHRQRRNWLGLLALVGLLGTSAPWALAQSTGTRMGSAAQTAATREAIFAGGCFWCMEEAFEKIPGVVSVDSGYTGGQVSNPDYKSVSKGTTGHIEAIRVTFDPTQTSYDTLLRHYWANIDPTAENRQFCDTGPQYRSAIFAMSDEQLKAAQASKQALEQSKRFPKVYTEILMASPFYMAEEYHQDYYRKNPFRYRYYKSSCGREARLEQVWGKNRP